MELKAFKGMPHEFGGIDYTEGSEVEGGEFAVQIGKSGNEYIFDKNSSEGERLSKEYKKLDKNGRLTEDDPLALEAFDQIAREEALKHAQRSVNEKGIDPFRNMYEQAGQAANGGVKYATGGPMMNPAEVPNVNPGAQYNTSMSYAPKTAEEYYRQTQGESRMRDSFGTQAMREEPTQKAFKEIGAGKEFGMLMGDIFFTPVTSAFTGKSFSEMVMEDQGYSSSDATKRAVGDDTMTGTAFGYGFAESEGVISNLGSSAFASMGDGGALKPKKKYSGGGASGWLALFEGIHNIRQTSKQIAGPAIDAETADKMGDEYVRNPIAGAPTTSGNPNINFNAFKKEGFDPETEVAFTGSGLDQEWMMDPNQTYAMPPASDTTSMVGTDVPIDLGTGSSAFGGDFGGFGGFKSGGAKPVYGYYANGGGKSYTDKIKDAERDFNESLDYPMDRAKRAYFDELYDNPRLAGDDMYLDPYRHGMAGYYTADAMKKKMPDWMPESVANKLAIAGSTIAGVGHEFASPSTERMGLVDALTEAGQDAYNNYVGAKMIEDVLFDREAKQLMLDKIKREETYPGVVVSDTEPYAKRDNALQPVPFNTANLKTVKFQNGGGKKKDEDKGEVGIAVTPTGAAYSSDQISLDNRGVGSSDYGIIPANLEQYFYTLLGGNKQFTEKDMTPEEYETLVKLYNLRKDSNTIGYGDHDSVGSTDIAKAGILTKLKNEPDIIRNLIGKAAVKDGYITSDYNFGNKPLLEILKDPSVEDLLAWAHNNSPFVDSEAMAKKDAIKIKMPN